MKTIGKLIIFVFTILTLAASAHAAADSPLFDAITQGDKAEVEALLAKGADVNVKNSDRYMGMTPLHKAAFGWKDIAKLLLAKGADVNARNVFGATPLHNAAGVSGGQRDIVELLLANGADVNARDQYGWTPLHSAANSGQKDVVELLLAKGADIDAKNGLGKTPLDVVASWEKGEGGVAGLLKEYPIRQAILLEHVRSNPRAAFIELTARLEGNSFDDITRRLIIKLASELKPAPAIPEEARKHFVEGTAIVKAAKNPAQQALAVQSFTEALKVAPWWGDAYYNLGVAQELAEKYYEAEQAFNFYMLSNPGETEKREVQDRIYALSAKRKLLGAK